jgi:hypothetical protein
MYHISDSPDKKNIENIVIKYRKQIKINACNNCYINQIGGCDGILYDYAAHNKNYLFRNISELEFKKIQKKIVIKKINNDLSSPNNS